MACPVCFGGEDTVVRESLNAGIVVLLGTTGVVMSGFAAFFITLARRASDVQADGAPGGTPAPAAPTVGRDSMEGMVP